MQTRPFVVGCAKTGDLWSHPVAYVSQRVRALCLLPCMHQTASSNSFHSPVQGYPNKQAFEAGMTALTDRCLSLGALQDPLLGVAVIAVEPLQLALLQEADNSAAASDVLAATSGAGDGGPRGAASDTGRGGNNGQEGAGRAVTDAQQVHTTASHSSCDHKCPPCCHPQTHHAQLRLLSTATHWQHKQPTLAQVFFCLLATVSALQGLCE